MAIANPFETDVHLSRRPRMHEDLIVLGSEYVDAIEAGRTVLGSTILLCRLHTMRILFPDYSCGADLPPASSAILGDRCASPGKSLNVQFYRVSYSFRRSGSCSIVRVVRESSASLRHSIDGTKAVTSRMQRNATPDIALEGTSTPCFPVF
jgi:hypothetical protein